MPEFDTIKSYSKGLSQPEVPIRKNIIMHLHTYMFIYIYLCLWSNSEQL